MGCGSSQQKPEDSRTDVRINTDARQRQRQTASMPVGGGSSAVEVSPDVTKGLGDKRVEENEQLRVIVSATNKNFIGVASLSYETPPGIDEASQRYKIVVLGAPPRIPPTMFALPMPSKQVDANSISTLLSAPMDAAGEQAVNQAAETLSGALDDITIPINAQELIVEWSMAASLHSRGSV